MTTPRVTPAPPALNLHLEELAERIERELERLRKKRPHLSDRIDRAANIVVTHLSCRRQRHQVIRVRIGKGRSRFLVSGSGGAVYSVDPADWTCSCPDHHRRDAACKHALACYLLVRASRPLPKLPACTACGQRFPHGELIEITHEDESLTWFPGDLLCKACVRDHGGIS
ncbi:MAG: SWIM zinc finger family protein [Actinomycetota bacterium]|nr:SWIM zinc finger family protein [Actinomycetota bacterium]